MSYYSDDAVMLKGLIDNFQNRIDTIMTLYGKYDPHMLGLLDKATYQERVKRISDIAVAYTNRALELAKTGRLLMRIDNRLKNVMTTTRVPVLDESGQPVKTKGGKTKMTKGQVCTDMVYHERWSLARVGVQEWYDEQVDLISQVQAHFAGFRSIALVESFKAFQKDVRSGLGIEESELRDVENKVEDMASKRADAFPLATPLQKSKVKISQVSPDDLRKIEDLGLRPEDLFTEG